MNQNDKLQLKENTAAIQLLIDNAKEANELAVISGDPNNADIIIIRLNSTGQTVQMSIANFVTFLSSDNLYDDTAIQAEVDLNSAKVSFPEAPNDGDAYARKNSSWEIINVGDGSGDMVKATYDQNNNGIVDNAEKVNGKTVEENVPAGAVFTDTVYDDTDVLKDVDTVSPVTPINKLLTQNDIPAGGNSVLVDNGDGTFTHTSGDGTITSFDAKGTLVDNSDGTFTFTDASGVTVTFNTNDLNTSLVDNGDGTFTYTSENGTITTFIGTDTVYDDTAIQSEVTLNTAKETNVNHPLVEEAVPAGAVFTDTIHRTVTNKTGLNIILTPEEFDGGVITTDATAFTSWIIPFNFTAPIGSSCIIIPPSGSHTNRFEIYGDSDVFINGVDEGFTRAYTGYGDATGTFIKITKIGDNNYISELTSKYSGLEATVFANNPSGANPFATTTDLYDDTVIQAEVDLNTAKETFPEAPNNGTQYARKDLGWEAVSGINGAKETGNPIDLDYILELGDVDFDGSGTVVKIDDGLGIITLLADTLLTYPSYSPNNGHSLVNRRYVDDNLYDETISTINKSGNFTLTPAEFHRNNVVIDMSVASSQWTIPLDFNVPIGSFCRFIVLNNTGSFRSFIAEVDEDFLYLNGEELGFTQVIGESSLYGSSILTIRKVGVNDYVSSVEITSKRAYDIARASSGIFATTTDLVSLSKTNTDTIVEPSFLGMFKTNVPNNATAYSLAASQVGHFEERWINAPSEPTVAGATKIAGSAFVANTDMDMITKNNGTIKQYYFLLR